VCGVSTLELDRQGMADRAAPSRRGIVETSPLPRLSVCRATIERFLAGEESATVLGRPTIPPATLRSLAAWAQGGDTVDVVIDITKDARPDIGADFDDALRHALRDDVWSLAAAFASVAGSTRIRVVFGPVRGDQCRKFHVDWLRLRLVTTYVGKGTEWIADEDVDRDALLHAPESPAAANAQILRAGGVVRHVRTGDALLMKGARFSSRQHAAVHRSPPIEGTGQVRVVLILSTVDA
jgi:hypothetical protein